MRFALPCVAIVAATTLALSGCQSSTSGSTSTEASPTHAPAAKDSLLQKALETSRAALPSQAPKRVVSMSVGLTQIADALDVPLVGVPTSQNPLPEGTKDLPQIGNSVEPDLEKIAELAPDLILSPASIGESIDKKIKPLNLESSNLPTDSVVELEATALALGELFDSQDQARELVRKVDQAQQEASTVVSETNPKKVLMLFGSPGELMVMGENTFAGEIANDLGATNVAALLGQEESYTPLSMEQVIAQDPDVVLILAHGDAEAVLDGVKKELAEQPAWGKVSASKNDAIHALPFELYGISSITDAPEAISNMAAALGS
ncbi:helical backbone metal receptor [Glutamicibacter sp. NPDC087344]|uniref:helical backbone metal receptor n=1 Tax=Glutamicibacter sp. NPDC087344 TaxID=3363994 RepID=UPI0038086F23